MVKSNLEIDAEINEEIYQAFGPNTVSDERAVS